MHCAVADPFLLQRDGKLYLFYETKAAQLGKGQIGVAVSSDGGTSFQHLGVVLHLPWHLSYPFVFEHGRQVGVLVWKAGPCGCVLLFDPSFGGPSQRKPTYSMADSHHPSISMLAGQAQSCRCALPLAGVHAT